MHELLMKLAAFANIGCFLLELYRYWVHKRKEDAKEKEKRQDTES